MKNKFKKFIEKLFCKHRFNYLGKSNNRFIYEDKELDVSIYYYECVKCGKRIAMKRDDMFYSPSTLEKVKLWKKHQIEINFTEEKK